ncbi:transcription factor 15 [Tupaia chinensis]|uniref:transcription factor 15 n=1 Tax=Tupaia chinensis TaxID=246437 RepID=UPI0003C8D1A1|nr:transcription factor 15 [Tupaia chinensis]
MAFALLRPVGAHVLYPDVRLLSEDEENRSESDASDQSFGCCAVPAAAADGRQPRSICTFCLSNQRKGGGRRDLGGSCLKVRGVAPLRGPRR